MTSSELVYMLGHFGLYEYINDWAYVMDDFGNAVRVPFNLPQWYFQTVDGE